MVGTDSLSLHEQISLLSGSDFWHTQPLANHGVPAIRLSDGPHGMRVLPDDADHLGLGSSLPATCFPPAVTIASAWDEELAEEVGRAVAAEALDQGVSVVLGPGLNIKRHPLCGRNFEYLSEDPLVSGRLAAALVRGIQSGGVGACLKHFAVNNQESHRLVVDAVVDERTLRELYLAGFEYAVTVAQPWTVMAAYNLVNGTYCAEHHTLLTRILRDEWGFDGLVMSDWGATNDRAAGVRAGMDLEMPGSGGISDSDVAAQVASGELSSQDVRSCADRVLDLVARSQDPEPVDVSYPDHDALSRRAAAEGTVLLTNDGILPLSAEATVAVIGGFAKSPRYQGAGSSLVNPTSVTTAWDAFTERGMAVTYALGYDPFTSGADQKLIAEAVDAARRAEVVVLMVGLPGVYESEGFDRSDLYLPPQQERLIEAVCEANPRTVVALSNGAPIAMPWVDRPAAIVESYLGGQASGAALVDVLYGEVNPGGRLAETFPRTQAQVPSDPWFPGHPHQVEYREGLMVGYRYYTSTGVAPLFSFGHGLSYTSFEYGPATVDCLEIVAGDSITITVPVTNVGERSGSDVVQVYLHDRSGLVQRPRRELRGFAKVRLDAGESTDVTISLGVRAFAYFDTEAHDWRIPTGVVGIEIGHSSADIDQTLTVTVTDGATTAPGRPDAPLIAASDRDFRARLGHAIPSPRPVRPYTRTSTVGEIQATMLGRGIKAILKRVGGIDTTAREGDLVTAKLLERGLDELPLRSAALLSQGQLSWPIVDTVVELLNGNPVAAAGKAVSGLATQAGRQLRRVLPRGTRDSQ
ncbi:MAG: glycoside hydrolase family 3 C-terminal domain-containing protein [Actinomycetes bacterium]